MIKNRYGMLRRIANRLHAVSPFFHFTKRFSRPFKIMRLRRKIAAFAFPESPAESDPLFTSVEIETLNRCNGSCGFCPVSGGRDPRPLKKMSRELFRKIIAGLSAIGFAGDVHLFSNNEPFLDTRIYEFAAHAKASLSSARIVIFSNGTLLDVEKYRRIIDSIDMMVIDNYCLDYKLRPNVAAIAHYIDTRPVLWRKTSIEIRYEKEVLTTRGGRAPNAIRRRGLTPLVQVGCLLPARQLIIRPDGKLSLCCNDALGTVTIGDVGTDALLDAWNGAAAREARRCLLRARDRFPICVGCDTMY